MRKNAWSFAVLFATLALVSGLAVSACHTAGSSTPMADTTSTGMSDSNAAPMVDDASKTSMAANADYSLGYCRVALNAPAPCVAYRGKQASGVAPGCQHDNCTTAKSNARANLLTGIPAACGAYIQCNDPCRCIQKMTAGDIVNSSTPPMP
jgi:hypothetical protein